jgi:hypothetical protein
LNTTSTNSGHFNRQRGFGVEHDYPGVGQFVTLLRDPYDAAISAYHYLRRCGHDRHDQSRVPKDSLCRFLLDTPPNILNHLAPRALASDWPSTPRQRKFRPCRLVAWSGRRSPGPGCPWRRLMLFHR